MEFVIEVVGLVEGGRLTVAAADIEAGIVARTAEFFGSIGIHRRSGRLTDTRLSRIDLMMGCRPVEFGRLDLRFVPKILVGF